jgi:AcrR family transcriptional regulator
MPKAGTPSRVTTKGSERSSVTRQQLVDAAIESLKTDGYAGASARTIAQRAGLNQGLIFYHFGSVANLLLAALDAVSAQRFELYTAQVSAASTPSQLVEAAEGIFRNDLDAGYIAVLVEMIAGASSTPGLSSEVATRIEPWREFARSTIESALGDSPLRAILGPTEIAHAVVALYLGLEMLSNLDGNPEPAIALFAHAKRLATLLEALTTPTDSEESA